MVTKKTKEHPSDKRKNVDTIMTNPELEQKREAFQRAVVSKRPIDAPAPKHHTPRKRTIIIIVGALMAFIGTVVAVYGYFWYQSPSKIVLDSVLNAANASSVSYTGMVIPDGSSNPDVTFKGGSKDGTTQVDAVIKTAFSGAIKNMNASVVTTQTNTYVKVDKASELLRQLAPAKQKGMYEQAANVVKRQVDGKWISVTPKEMGTLSSLSDVSTCSVESLRDMGVDKKANQALATLYLQHRFMNIEEIASNGSMGTYTLSFDKDKLSSFADAAAGSADVPKALSECVTELQAAHATEIDTIKITLDINKAERMIKSVTVATGSSLKLTVKATPMFNQHPSIAVPTNAIKFSDVTTDIFKQYVNSTFQMMSTGLSSVIMGS